jgi:hypothetical protein
MEKAWSARLIVTQLTSIVDYLDRMCQGNFRFEHIERLQASNDILKDCILLQKGIALENLKPGMMSQVCELVSDGDCMKLSLVMENIRPTIKIEETRVNRITGPLLPGNKIDPAVVAANIKVLFESLQIRYRTATDENVMELLQPSTLNTIEAFYEIIHRLIIQTSVEPQ